MNSENKKIGQKIRKARIANNLTQSELGKTIGKTGSAIGYLEGGLRKITPDTLKRIADVLNKPFKYFYENEANDYSVFEKLMAIEKQFKDVSELVKKAEKEKFEFKEFYVDLVRESTGVVIYLNEDAKLTYMNKKANILLNTNNKKSAFELKIKKIKDDHQKEIIANTKFTFSIEELFGKPLVAKSVYERNGKYLGLWITEDL